MKKEWKPRRSADRRIQQARTASLRAPLNRGAGAEACSPCARPADSKQVSISGAAAGVRGEVPVAVLQSYSFLGARILTLLKLARFLHESRQAFVRQTLPRGPKPMFKVEMFCWAGSVTSKVTCHISPFKMSNHQHDLSHSIHRN